MSLALEKKIFTIAVAVIDLSFEYCSWNPVTHAEKIKVLVP